MRVIRGPKLQVSSSRQVVGDATLLISPATSPLPHTLLPPPCYLTALLPHCHFTVQGGHGTAESGGGYRYDGLYTVETAALVPSHNTRFKTAMFTLVRRKL